MPNWAIGSVDVTGTREAALAFSDRFITSDKISTVAGRKYFARSFVEESREDFRNEISEYFKSVAPDEKRTFNLGVMFAWSATSCTISGYPQQNSDECITLAEACMEDRVSVEIHTSETGMCFEEEIICDEKGNCSDEERDLIGYCCPECGEIWSLASFEDPDDYDTYSNLMATLSLGSLHKESLFKRGMNSQQIEWAGYRTTPAVRSQKIVTTLLECGCSLEGVPGFYINKTTGRWELDIRGSGIMLPDRNIHGEIEAIQIRLDKTVHSKFNNLTSTGKYFGATSACCPHYVGYCHGMDTVYVTEGVMKSDIAYCLSRQLGKARAFVGLTGVANTNQYMRALTELYDEGVRRIILAFDSDAEFNPHVAQALKNAEQLGIEHGFDVYPLCWDPHFKGIDDLMLSFKEY